MVDETEKSEQRSGSLFEEVTSAPLESGADLLVPIRTTDAYYGHGSSFTIETAEPISQVSTTASS